MNKLIFTIFLEKKQKIFSTHKEILPWNAGTVYSTQTSRWINLEFSIFLGRKRLSNGNILVRKINKKQMKFPWEVEEEEEKDFPHSTQLI